VLEVSTKVKVTEAREEGRLTVKLIVAKYNVAKT
jgi:hypothetical protein